MRGDYPRQIAAGFLVIETHLHSVTSLGVRGVQALFALARFQLRLNSFGSSNVCFKSPGVQGFPSFLSLFSLFYPFPFPCSFFIYIFFVHMWLRTYPVIHRPFATEHSTRFSAALNEGRKRE